MDNQRNVTHVTFLGDDPTASLTPIIDKNIPSQRVIIAYEEHQFEQVNQIKKVIQTRGYKVEKWLLPTTFNTEEIKCNFIALFEQESSHPSELWLNASNGSRYQILASYEVARNYKASIYVVEPKNDGICWLYPANKKLTPIADKLKLHEFLSVHGCLIKSQQNKQGISSDMRKLGENWLKSADSLQAGLAKLNFLAQGAQGPKFTSYNQDDAMLADESLQSLITDLVEFGLVEIEGRKIHFQNETTRFFANGGWLEEITFSYIRGLRTEIPEIQDDGQSVEIERVQNNQVIRNELDVVALVNNKLYIIECKTQKLNSGDGASMLYKINSLGNRLGGLKCRTAIVTFNSLNKTEVARAKDLDIKIFNNISLKNLKSELRTWLKNL